MIHWRHTRPWGAGPRCQTGGHRASRSGQWGVRTDKQNQLEHINITDNKGNFSDGVISFFFQLSPATCLSHIRSHSSFNYLGSIRSDRSVVSKWVSEQGRKRDLPEFGGTGCVCFLGHGGAGTSATAWRQGIVCKQKTYQKNETTLLIYNITVLPLKIYMIEISNRKKLDVQKFRRVWRAAGITICLMKRKNRWSIINT